MKKLKFSQPLMVLALVIIVALTMIVSACSSSSTPTSTTPATQTASSGGGPSTINLVAQNLSFNMNTITVKAGSQVTVNFNNMDSGIPHNFAVYNDSSASQTIFKGDTVTGPGTKTYTFTAPSTAGTYFFRCDIHPTQMYGQFIVQ